MGGVVAVVAFAPTLVLGCQEGVLGNGTGQEEITIRVDLVGAVYKVVTVIVKAIADFVGSQVDRLI